MATIANLSIGLSADSATLKKDLDRAQSHSKKWAKKQKSQFAGVAQSIKGIGVAIAAVGFGSMIRDAAETSKELKIMSNMTGISTTKLQQITPSLSRAGISVEKYGDIVKDVNDKMHDFHQAGAGPMKDFFEQIAPKVGLTADAFKELSGEQALQLYVTSLEKAGLSTEQMTFYMEALASDSTMLLPLLKNNAAGMNEFATSVDEVMSEEAQAGLIDMVHNMKALGVSLRNLAVNYLAPLLKLAADHPQLTALGIAMGALGLSVSILVPLLAPLASGIAAVGLALLANPIGLAIAAIATAIGLVAIASPKLRTALGNMGNGMKSLETSVDNVRIAMGDELAQWQLLTGVMGNGTSMTSDAAIAKLSEADAHLRNAEALQAETKATLGLQLAKLELQRLTLQAALEAKSAGGTDLESMPKRLRDSYEETEASLVKVMNAQTGLRDIIAESGTKTRKVREETEELRAKILEAKGGMVTFGEVIPVAATERLAYVADSISFSKPLEGARKLAKELGVSLHSAMAMMGLLGDASKFSGDPFDPRASDYDSYAKRLERARRIIEDGSLYTSTGSSGSGGGGGGTTIIKDDLVAPDDGRYGVEEFVNSFQTGLAEAFKTGDFKGFLSGLLDNFTSGIIDNFTKSITDGMRDMDLSSMQAGLGNLFSGLFSGLMGSGGGGGLFSSIFGSSFGSIFHAASGGIVPTTPFSKSYADSVPTMLMPGELVVPKSQVDNFMGASGGGSGQTFNINVTGDVSRLTRKEIVKMMPEIAQGTNSLNKENNFRR